MTRKGPEWGTCLTWHHQGHFAIEMDGQDLGWGIPARLWASAMLGLQCGSAALCTPGNLCSSLRWDMGQKFLSALQQLLTALWRTVQTLSWISQVRTVKSLSNSFSGKLVVFHVTCTLKDTNNSKYVSGKTEIMLYLHLTPCVQWALAGCCNIFLNPASIQIKSE